MGDWKEKLATEFKRDWKRTGLLVLLVIAGVVVVIHQFAGSPNAANGPSPKAAMADAMRPGGESAAARAATAAAPVPKPNARPAGPGENARLDSLASGFGVQESLPPPAVRDPFRTDLSRFPPDPDAQVKVKPAVTPTAAAELAEQESRRLAEEAMLKEQAARLPLQSILMASPARAMIGKDIYQVGQRVGLFVLTKINPQSVVLEKDGFEVILRLE